MMYVQSLTERIFSQLHEGSSISNVGLIGFWTGTHDFSWDKTQDSPEEFVTKSLFDARIWLHFHMKTSSLSNCHMHVDHNF